MDYILWICNEFCEFGSRWSLQFYDLEKCGWMFIQKDELQADDHQFSILLVRSAYPRIDTHMLNLNMWWILWSTSWSLDLWLWLRPNALVEDDNEQKILQEIDDIWWICDEFCKNRLWVKFGLIAMTRTVVNFTNWIIAGSLNFLLHVTGRS